MNAVARKALRRGVRKIVPKALYECFVIHFPGLEKEVQKHYQILASSKFNLSGWFLVFFSISAEDFWVLLFSYHKICYIICAFHQKPLKLISPTDGKCGGKVNNIESNQEEKSGECARSRIILLWAKNA